MESDIWSHSNVSFFNLTTAAVVHHKLALFDTSMLPEIIFFLRVLLAFATISFSVPLFAANSSLTIQAAISPPGLPLSSKNLFTLLAPSKTPNIFSPIRYVPSLLETSSKTESIFMRIIVNPEKKQHMFSGFTYSFQGNNMLIVSLEHYNYF